MEQIETRNQQSGASEMPNGIDNRAMRATTAVHETVDRIANAARPAVDRLAQTAHQTVDRVSTFASSAAGTLQQKRGEYGTRGNEMMDEARDYVRSNPLKAVGIAAVVGYMLSKMFRSESGSGRHRY